MKKKLYKALLSILLFGVSFLCFYIPSKTTTSIVNKHINEITITTENDGSKLFFNYVGLFLLIMTIWIWRKEMKINQLGFIGSNGIEPTDPESLLIGSTPEKPMVNGQGEKPTKPDDINLELQEFKKQDLKKNIVNYLKSKPFGLTNKTILSHSFGVSIQVIEVVLFELMKENLIRRDTYPGSGRANYSLTSSLENKAIEDFITNFIRTKIVSDNRFVRVNQRYEVDAIIKTTELSYIVEVKRMDNISTKRLDDTIKHLLTIEEQIKLSPIKLVLIISTNQDIDKQRFFEYLNIENFIIHIYKYDKDE